MSTGGEMWPLVTYVHRVVKTLLFPELKRKSGRLNVPVRAPAASLLALRRRFESQVEGAPALTKTSAAEWMLAVREVLIGAADAARERPASIAAARMVSRCERIAVAESGELRLASDSSPRSWARAGARCKTASAT